VSAPAAADPATTITENSAQVGSCRQITTLSIFTGDDNGNGSTAVEIGTTATGPWTTVCSSLIGSSPRQCLLSELTPGDTHYLRITFADPDGVVGTNPEVLGPLSTPTCGADQAPPTLVFQSPVAEATIGGVERFKVEVSDQGGMAATDPVTWTLDGASVSAVAAVNPNYFCGGDCAVYEFDLDTTTLLNGAHYVTVEAVDQAGNTGLAALPLAVANQGADAAGNGLLLRRTHGSQTCIDCHNLQTHSSHATGVRYGNWAVDCLSCHTPHRTRNIYLVREDLRTPSSGTATVVFHEDDRTGGSNPQLSYLGDYSGPNNTPYDDGICEVCHTRTNHYRNDASGGDHTHNAATRCLGCHPHSAGFAAGESIGSANCSGCHPQIWQKMNGDIAVASRHTLGNVVGVNDAFTDSGVSWGSPLAAIPAADRSCVNMCHQDHVHNEPGGTTHDFNVHEDAASAASRQVTRGSGGEITGGTPARTDFSETAADGGMCVSCHLNAVSVGRRAIDKVAFNASAHNYSDFATYGAWTYTLHDGSAFDRNCTKCHADRADARPGASASPFGAVHYSDYPRLLAGNINPAGAGASAAENICYNCHGTAGTGEDLSGKDVASVVARASNHPVENDAVHDTVVESNATFNDGTFKGANRHVNCLDCHDTHVAKPGVHVPADATLAGALAGADGVTVASLPGNWGSWGSSNFGASLSTVGREYQICLKCHSSFAYNTTPPSGETDQAKEFNVNNDAYHWVMSDQTATQDATWGGTGTPRTADPSRVMTFTSSTPWTRTSVMVCSDCHSSDVGTDPEGPHGSGESPILRAPWSTTTGAGSTGDLCFICHDYDTYATKDSSTSPTGFANGGGQNLHAKHVDKVGSAYACVMCHAFVPHGWQRKALIAWTSDPAPYNGGSHLSSMTFRSDRNYSKNSCSTASGCH